MRKPFAAALLAALPFAAVLLAAACSDGDDVAPAYIQELADVATGADGLPQRLERDNGETCAVLSAGGVKALRADTLYRAAVAYTRGDGGVSVASVSTFLAPAPRVYPAEVLVLDKPVEKVAACWSSGKYLNFKLSLLTENSVLHAFAFHEAGLRQNADGTRTLRLRLLHQQSGDAAYYTRTAYVSLPLSQLSGRLRRGTDSVYVTVSTSAGSSAYTRLYAAAE